MMDAWLSSSLITASSGPSSACTTPAMNRGGAVEPPHQVMSENKHTMCLPAPPHTYFTKLPDSVLRHLTHLEEARVCVKAGRVQDGVLGAVEGADAGLKLLVKVLHTQAADTHTAVGVWSCGCSKVPAAAGRVTSCCHAQWLQTQRQLVYPVACVVWVEARLDTPSSFPFVDPPYPHAP